MESGSMGHGKRPRTRVRGSDGPDIMPPLSENVDLDVDLNRLLVVTANL